MINKTVTLSFRKQYFAYLILFGILAPFSFSKKIISNAEYLTRPSDIMPEQTVYDEIENENDTVSGSDSLMSTYFNNLIDYQPMNIGGSCGFVSLISVLSYYDSIKNDNIIPEQYERRYENALTYSSAIQKSPGVYRSNFSASLDGSAAALGHQQLYNYISSSYTYDYESYLIKEYNEMNSTYNSTSIGYKIGEWDYDSLLDEVLSVNYSVTVDYAPNTAAAESDYYYMRFINETKSYIDDGKPVILHLVDSDEVDGEVVRTHHSVVAYDYDDNGLYCNYGWGSGYTHANFHSDFDYIYYIAVLDFDTSEYGHSNNLRYNGTDYCYCGVTTHQHNCNTYIDYSDAYHLARCSCGYSYFENHIYDPRELQLASIIFNSCLLCGHTDI